MYACDLSLCSIILKLYLPQGLCCISSKIRAVQSTHPATVGTQEDALHIAISSQADMHNFADDDSQEQSPCNKILEFDDTKGCQEDASHDETSAFNESEVALS